MNQQANTVKIKSEIMSLSCLWNRPITVKLHPIESYFKNTIQCHACGMEYENAVESFFSPSPDSISVEVKHSYHAPLDSFLRLSPNDLRLIPPYL